MSSKYRRDLENWLGELDVKADTVFDVGGAQLPVKGRTKSWDVKKYKIIDLAEPHELKKAPHYVFDMEGVDSWQKEYGDQADLVFCLEVMEYIIDPVQAIENIRFMLKSGGKAYVSFGFVYPMHQPVKYDSLRYTLNGIHRIVSLAGLKITQVRERLDHSDMLIPLYKMNLMHMADGMSHNVLGWIVELTHD